MYSISAWFWSKVIGDFPVDTVAPIVLSSTVFLMAGIGKTPESILGMHFFQKKTLQGRPRVAWGQNVKSKRSETLSSPVLHGYVCCFESLQCCRSR